MALAVHGLQFNQIFTLTLPFHLDGLQNLLEAILDLGQVFCRNGTVARWALSTSLQSLGRGNFLLILGHQLIDLGGLLCQCVQQLGLIDFCHQCFSLCH